MTTHRAPADPVGTDLNRLLKALKLGALADTLPERAALARQHKLSHIGFLEVLLADEVSRRESRSAALRSAKAGLDPTMHFDTWTAVEDLRYDRTLLGDLTSLRFLDAGQSAIILGPTVIEGWSAWWQRLACSGRCCDRCNVRRGVDAAAGQFAS